MYRTSALSRQNLKHSFELTVNSFIINWLSLILASSFIRFSLSNTLFSSSSFYTLPPSYSRIYIDSVLLLSWSLKLICTLSLLSNSPRFELYRKTIPKDLYLTITYLFFIQLSQILIEFPQQFNDSFLLSTISYKFVYEIQILNRISFSTMKPLLVLFLLINTFNITYASFFSSNTFQLLSGSTLAFVSSYLIL